MSYASRSLADCLRRCRQLGIAPSRWVLVVSVSRQNVSLFAGFVGTLRFCVAHPLPLSRTNPPYGLIRRLRCSTSRFGIGQDAGSDRTPLGLHRIAEKIGGGWPVGTVFKSRQPVGFTWQGLPLAKITTRILWLEGLERGFNRGGKVDSHARYIYMHGTGDEPGLGRPASHGCIQLAADDLIPLFDQVPGGTLVWIER